MAPPDIQSVGSVDTGRCFSFLNQSEENKSVERMTAVLQGGIKVSILETCIMSRI